MDVLDGGGDGEVGGHGLHHLGHGLDLQPIGSDQRLLLLLERSVALVHGAELVAAAPHAVGPYRWTDRQTNRERERLGWDGVSLAISKPPSCVIPTGACDCKATFPTPLLLAVRMEANSILTRCGPKVFPLVITLDIYLPIPKHQQAQQIMSLHIHQGNKLL